VRKSGVHTRTAYKLIPVPSLKKRGTREKERERERERGAQGKTEERGHRGKRRTEKGEEETE